MEKFIVTPKEDKSVTMTIRIDDRLGGYIILEAAKKAKERGCTCGIYAATTVGEELTKHGAAWCASRIAPTRVTVQYLHSYEPKCIKNHLR